MRNKYRIIIGIVIVALVATVTLGGCSAKAKKADVDQLKAEFNALKNVEGESQLVKLLRVTENGVDEARATAQAAKDAADKARMKFSFAVVEAASEGDDALSDQELRKQRKFMVAAGAEDTLEADLASAQAEAEAKAKAAADVRKAALEQIQQLLASKQTDLAAADKDAKAAADRQALIAKIRAKMDTKAKPAVAKPAAPAS